MKPQFPLFPSMKKAGEVPHRLRSSTQSRLSPYFWLTPEALLAASRVHARPHLALLRQNVIFNHRLFEQLIEVLFHCDSRFSLHQVFGEFAFDCVHVFDNRIGLALSTENHKLPIGFDDPRKIPRLQFKGSFLQRGLSTILSKRWHLTVVASRSRLTEYCAANSPKNCSVGLFLAICQTSCAVRWLLNTIANISARGP